MKITDLPEIIDQQETQFRDKFDRIFRVSQTQAQMDIPKTMEDWIVGQFGDLAAVASHRIVRVDNTVLYNGSLYNSIRALRPQTKEPYDMAQIDEESNKPPFTKVQELTPADVFGRIEGQHSTTASNVAKYDGWHGLVVFDEPHPLEWSEAAIADYFDVANRWFTKVHEQDAQAKYPMFVWNCLWKAAASIVHGHAQVLVAREHPYQYITYLKERTREFSGNYFETYFDLHQSLGLAWEKEGIHIVIPIDQQKEREVQIWSDGLNDKTAQMLHAVLVAYRDELGVQSFNVAGYLKPLVVEDGWDHMPTIMRLVDRGSLSTRNADIGVMERFAGQQIIENDPFVTAEILQALFS